MAPTHFPRESVDVTCFNNDLVLPYALRVQDFQMAMQDVYDFLHDVNNHLVNRACGAWSRCCDRRPSPGILSDMLTASLANHSRSLTENQHFNGHPDLLVRGTYPGDAEPAGEEGVEVKCTKKAGEP